MVHDHEAHGTARRLAAYLADSARDVCVADVRIGLGYTAVRLEDGRAGVAYTFRDQVRGGCSVLKGVRPLSGRPATDLLRLLDSQDAIEVCVGLACANALANQSEPGHLQGDLLEHLDIRPDDDIAMVGHFEPLVAPIRARAHSLAIFERVAEPTEWLRPQEEAVLTLPRCQVAVVTATSLINQTLDDLLEAAHGCREVALLGASTPLCPAVFTATPVTMLSGIVVTNPEEVLRVVSEGGGMRQFGPYIRKVSVKTRGASK